MPYSLNQIFASSDRNVDYYSGTNKIKITTSGIKDYVTFELEDLMYNRDALETTSILEPSSNDKSYLFKTRINVDIEKIETSGIIGYKLMIVQGGEPKFQKSTYFIEDFDGRINSGTSFEDFKKTVLDIRETVIYNTVDTNKDSVISQEELQEFYEDDYKVPGASYSEYLKSHQLNGTMPVPLENILEGVSNVSYNINKHANDPKGMSDRSSSIVLSDGVMINGATLTELRAPDVHQSTDDFVYGIKGSLSNLTQGLPKATGKLVKYISSNFWSERILEVSSSNLDINSDFLLAIEPIVDDALHDEHNRHMPAGRSGDPETESYLQVLNFRDASRELIDECQSASVQVSSNTPGRILLNIIKKDFLSNTFRINTRVVNGRTSDIVQEYTSDVNIPPGQTSKTFEINEITNVSPFYVQITVHTMIGNRCVSEKTISVDGIPVNRVGGYDSEVYRDQIEMSLYNNSNGILLVIENTPENCNAITVFRRDLHTLLPKRELTTFENTGELSFEDTDVVEGKSYEYTISYRTKTPGNQHESKRDSFSEKGFALEKYTLPGISNSQYWSNSRAKEEIKRKTPVAQGYEFAVLSSTQEIVRPNGKLSLGFKMQVTKTGNVASYQTIVDDIDELAQEIAQGNTSVNLEDRTIPVIRVRRIDKVSGGVNLLGYTVGGDDKFITDTYILNSPELKDRRYTYEFELFLPQLFSLIKTDLLAAGDAEGIFESINVKKFAAADGAIPTLEYLQSDTNLSAVIESFATGVRKYVTYDPLNKAEAFANSVTIGGFKPRRCVVVLDVKFRYNEGFQRFTHFLIYCNASGEKILIDTFPINYEITDYRRTFRYLNDTRFYPQKNFTVSLMDSGGRIVETPAFFKSAEDRRIARL